MGPKGGRGRDYTVRTVQCKTRPAGNGDILYFELIHPD